MHVGDDPDAVAANRWRLAVAAGIKEPAWLTQVHGHVVAVLDEAAPAIPDADAAITTRAGVVCAVMTADCLPVVLSSVDGAVVGVAHAGWRGLAAGVIESTVHAMRARAAQGVALQAWLAPAISAAHFEVGDEVRAAFLHHDAAAAGAFTPNARNRWQCDLYALARQRLQRAGIDAVTGGECCTYADEHRFYSHRRDVQHRGLAGTGRMATLIWRT
jgi:hypothetical protein